MKKLFLLPLFLMVFLMAGGQDFYDINTINTIEIEFEQTNWDYLLDQMAMAGNDERLTGSVIINGQEFDSVGIRYKGNSSYNPNQIKNPFNIKLDYIIDDQKLDGYGTLKLSNGFKDPTMIREVVGYEIARNYFPASLANYANVYVNGTHMGLYTSVQDVDKLFMRTSYGGDEGARIKGETDGPSGSVWQYFGQDSASYDSYYKLESDFGWAELIDFLDTLSNQTGQVENVLNVDRHLWFLAFSNLFVNLDGPINNPQNYYIFEDYNGQMNPIPWDLNECFGGFTNHQTLGQLNTYQLQHLSPFANINESNFPVISKILSNDTYRKMYVAHMKTILEEYVSNGYYEIRALEVQSIIDADVQADNNKFFTYSQFLSNMNNAVGGGPMGVIGVTQLMDPRAEYLENLPDFVATQPQISDNAVSPENPGPNSEVWFTVFAESCDEAYLACRKGYSGSFEFVEMFDDGAHNDGSAGDGVFGISRVVFNAGLQYYFYAENEDAAAFFPQRAANDFFTLSVSGSLVINEFLADNETTIADQDGEYDDWIEIYNNESQAINLGGYYLSDDLAAPDAWMFPDTIIEAGGYVVVWADKDEDQEGLHADIKLSKEGEAVILSNANLEVVDMIEFGAQQTDISTGRYENGTGEFISMTPTFGAENHNGIIGINESFSDISDIIVMPNPFSDKLTVVVDLVEASSVSMHMHSVGGQTIRMEECTYPCGRNSITLDTSSLNKGIWILTVRCNDAVMTRKVVK
jgi:hypothetical protein